MRRTHTTKSSNAYNLSDKDFTLNEDVLGEGTYGEVYQGTCDGKEVAIKVAKTKQSAQKAVRKENDILMEVAKLRIPHVIKYYGFVADPFAIVMEYLPNGSLGSYIHDNNGTPLNFKTCFKITEYVAIALTYLHKNGIVHCDIKSDNILFCDNSIKLCDFGFAKRKNDEIELMGSPRWMAPEVPDEPYSEKADVYSLAMTTWEAFAWKLPFDMLDTNAEIIDHVQNGYRPIIPSDWPAKIKSVISVSWEGDKDLRPSAAEFLSLWSKIKLPGKEKFPDVNIHVSDEEMVNSPFGFAARNRR